MIRIIEWTKYNNTLKALKTVYSKQQDLKNAYSPEMLLMFQRMKNQSLETFPKITQTVNVKTEGDSTTVPQL